MNIGFDLDKVFIDYPPFVPDKLIDNLYKQASNGILLYRIPSRLEQIIRIFSHYPLFRPLITNNMDYVKNLTLTNTNNYYLISSRFSFLEKRTTDLVKRYKLDKIFNTMYFNYSNNQPHHFKNRIIKKLNLDIYVDDDLDLLKYLIDRNPKTKFFWLNKKISKKINNNLFAITDLKEMFQ